MVQLLRFLESMTNRDITAYIPQRAPFVMVGAIDGADLQTSKTTFTILPDNIFVDNGFFTEPGLVENMAQTAAAGTGYRCQAEGKEVPVGYIGALKNLVIHELPRVGDTIQTEITFQHQVLNVHVVQGNIWMDGRHIASCELKIFLQEGA